MCVFKLAFHLVFDVMQVDLSSNLLVELPESFGNLRNLKVHISSSFLVFLFLFLFPFLNHGIQDGLSMWQLPSMAGRFKSCLNFLVYDFTLFFFFFKLDGKDVEHLFLLLKRIKGTIFSFWFWAYVSHFVSSWVNLVEESLMRESHL